MIIFANNVIWIVLIVMDPLNLIVLHVHKDNYNYNKEII